MPTQVPNTGLANPKDGSDSKSEGRDLKPTSTPTLMPHAENQIAEDNIKTASDGAKTLSMMGLILGLSIVFCALFWLSICMYIQQRRKKRIPTLTEIDLVDIYIPKAGSGSTQASSIPSVPTSKQVYDLNEDENEAKKASMDSLPWNPSSGAPSKDLLDAPLCGGGRSPRRRFPGIEIFLSQSVDSFGLASMGSNGNSVGDGYGDRDGGVDVHPHPSIDHHYETSGYRMRESFDISQFTKATGEGGSGMPMASIDECVSVDQQFTHNGVSKALTASFDLQEMHESLSASREIPETSLPPMNDIYKAKTKFEQQQTLRRQNSSMNPLNKDFDDAV